MNVKTVAGLLSVAALLGSPFASAADAVKAEALAKKEGCLKCHAVDKKKEAVSLKEVAKKYAGQKDAEATLINSITKGSTGKYGPVPMPPNTTPSADEVKALAKWVLAGAK